jgi:hypothetical protein
MEKNHKFEFKLDDVSKYLIETFSKSIFDLIINQNQLEFNARCVLKNSLNLLIVFIKKNIQIWERIENEFECSNWTNLLTNVLTSGIDSLTKKMASGFETRLYILMYLYEIIIVSIYL